MTAHQRCCIEQELADDRHELKAAQRQLRLEHAQLVKDTAATQDNCTLATFLL